MMKRFTFQGVWLVCLAAMLWATDAPFRSELLKTLPGSLIVMIEHFLGTLFVAPVLWQNRHELSGLRKKDWLAVLVIAIGSSALASMAFTQAFVYTSPSVAILLQKLQPLIAVVFAGIILKERLSQIYWLWALLAILGAYFISFSGLKPELFKGEVLNPNIIGVSLAIFAATLWGLGTVLGKHLLAQIDFKTLTSLRFILGFFFLFVFNFSQNTLPKITQINPLGWLNLFIITMASGVVSLFIYYKGLRTTKASVATIAELGFPLSAVLVNYLFLNAFLSLNQMLGMLVLLFAIFKLSKTEKLITN